MSKARREKRDAAKGNGADTETELSKIAELHAAPNGLCVLHMMPDGPPRDVMIKMLGGLRDYLIEQEVTENLIKKNQSSIIHPVTQQPIITQQAGN